jgi:hypothetical protein
MTEKEPTMRLPRRMTTCALACLATLAGARGAGAQDAPGGVGPPPEQAQEQRQLEAERRQLEAQRRQLEQQQKQIEQQVRRAREQAEQQGRRARDQAERAADRAREQAQRQFEHARRGFGGAMGLGGLPAPFGGQPGQPGQPQGGNFERELLKAHGLDTGPGDGTGAMTAFLGVATAPVPPAVRRRVDLPDGIGLVIGNVEPNSPAQQAGLKQYDILHKLNDQLLVNAEQLAVLVRTFKPGDTITLGIVRGGKMEQVPATLGERPAAPSAPQVEFFAPQGGQPPQPPQPVQPGQQGQPPQPAPRGMFRPMVPSQPPQRFHIQPGQPGMNAPQPVPAPPQGGAPAPARIFAQPAQPPALPAAPAPAPAAVPVQPAPATPQIHVAPIAPLAPLAIPAAPESPAAPAPAKLEC